MTDIAADRVDLIGLTRALVDIDSTTGREGDAARFLSRYLRELGYDVQDQQVDEHRFNVLATCGTPSVIFSTHFDCVPPFFPSRVDNGRIYGRGSCDAKGILAAQVAAADRLRADGNTRVGMLYVVGEERGSDGARRANAEARDSVYLVNGEPTDSRLGLATRGVLRVGLEAAGRAAHSSFPELGESAIDKLLDVLMEIRQVAWPSDELLGHTHYIVGLIAGGVAPNVVPPHADAELMFRTVGDAADIMRLLEPFASRVAMTQILEVPPVRLKVVPGFATAVFPYTTDIPFLRGWGEPLLFGPGSIHVAHTANEFIDIGEQRAAVDGYVRLAQHLLADATSAR